MSSSDSVGSTVDQPLIKQSIRVRKRDGKTTQIWDIGKIENAVQKAMEEVKVTSNGDFSPLVKAIIDECHDTGCPIIDVEAIQEIVKRKLMDYGYHTVAEAYILYSHKRAELRKKRATPDVGIIKEFIHLTRYSKWLQPLKRREITWEETTARSREMHIDRYPQIKELIDWSYDLVNKRSVLPSMRSMQFGGEAQKQHHAKGYNCAFSVCNRIKFFSEAFYLLLAGTGTGFSVQYRHVEQLPSLNFIDRAKVKHFIVEDTIEGWADALHELLLSYIEGYYIEFSYHQVRPVGSRLKTSGGRAPGHLVLHDALEHIRSVLDEAQGRQLYPIECYDIVCMSADAVYSGGIREAATICLFSIDDGMMMHAKTGKTWHIQHPWRARSNNSVVLVRSEIKKDQFKRIFNATKQWGEPGFFFCDDPDTGANPCVEIGLNPKLKITPTSKREIEKWAKKTNRIIPVLKVNEIHWGWQMCVSGDTKLITKDGITSITDAVGKSIEIWNGSQWNKVEPFVTGHGRKLYRVNFNDGSYLDATDNHKFLIADRFNNSYKEIETKDLMSYSKYSIHVPRSNINYMGCGGIFESKAYEYGFLLADGSNTVKNYTGKQYQQAVLYGSKIKLPLDGIRQFELDNSQYIRLDLDSQISEQLKNHKIGLPVIIFTWDYDSIISFISGWADGDGSKHNYGCRIYGSEDKIRDLQLLLSKVGIVSSVNLMSEEGDKTTLPNGRIGIRNYDIWYVFINDARKLRTNRIDVSRGRGLFGRSKWQIIESVNELPGLHTTYCVNESQLHQCVFNNVLTKQCNLTEVNCATLTTAEEFYDRVKAATIIGTCQAGYTDFPYLGWVSEAICSREALLGVSLTGMMDSPEIALNPEIQRTAAQLAVETNIDVAEKININPAARVTCIKPSGTASIVVGVVGSGIHAHHGRRYFRRIRANPTDPVYQLFKKKNPHMCVTVSRTKELIIFPVQAPDAALTRHDFTALQFLEKVKSTMENWVIPGTAKPNSSPGVNHNVSNTITVRPDEWELVSEFLWKNKEFFTGVSMLGYTGDKDFQNAPREEVTTEKDEAIWQDLIQNYQPIDWYELKEEEDNTDFAGEIACAGGACTL